MQNPILKDYADACKATEDQLKGLVKNNLLWDSTYRKAYGSFRQQEQMRGLTNEQIIKLHGSVSNIPGDCNRQRIQTDLDGEAATALRNKLKVYRSDQENMNSYTFLSTHFPDTYEEEFTVNSDGEVQIREGGVLLGTAINSFTLSC